MSAAVFAPDDILTSDYSGIGTVSDCVSATTTSGRVPWSGIADGRPSSCVDHHVSRRKRENGNALACTYAPFGTSVTEVLEKPRSKKSGL